MKIDCSARQISNMNTEFFKFDMSYIYKYIYIYIYYIILYYIIYIYIKKMQMVTTQKLSLYPYISKTWSQLQQICEIQSYRTN